MAVSTSQAMTVTHKSEDYPQTIKEDEQLETARAEMGQVREENERLKTTLEKIEKEYQSLQSRFFSILQQESPKREPGQRESSEPDLVSLCLGMSAPKTINKPTNKSAGGDGHDQDLNKTRLSLSLGPDSKIQLSSTSEIETDPTTKAEEAGSPSKIVKAARNCDDEVSQHANVKRSRVSVRARCDTPTMNDGCQWRKYGQKIAKANPCPRAYYRCTVVPGCPVRKQVQRCIDDMSILITTYEGTHNHSLPMSATAMASTTSAAASMLLSGSSTSATTQMPNGSNYNFYDNMRNNTTTQFYTHNSSPTITLDLTSSHSSPYSPHLNMFSSVSQRYPAANLGFSTLESNMGWGNKPEFGSLGFGRTSQEKLYEPAFEKTHQDPQQLLTDTLTRAITSDPSLRSAIATTISSMVGNGAIHGSQKEIDTQKLKWNEPVQNGNALQVKLLQ